MNINTNIIELRHKLNEFIASLDNTIKLGKELGIDLTGGIDTVNKSNVKDNHLNDNSTPSNNHVTNIKKATLKETVLNVVVSHIDRFTPTKEIVDLILPFYPSKDKEQFKTQVSSLLSLFKREGKIAQYNYSNSKKDSVWGKIEWLDVLKNPIDERKFIIK